jgi:hypothetical protein
MPSLDPQSPQQGILANTTTGIQGFVEATVLETHFKLGVFFPSYTRVSLRIQRVLDSLSHSASRTDKHISFDLIHRRTFPAGFLGRQ